MGQVPYPTRWSHVQKEGENMCHVTEWWKPLKTTQLTIIVSGQIIVTSHDLTPKGSWWREIPLFQGNPGWWTIITWPNLYPVITIFERPSKPPTFWNSYTRTLILDTILKLSGTIGVTQKTMAYDTHVCLILLQTLNPQERWGTHKKRWPFQPCPFADVIGLVRCSYDRLQRTFFFWPRPF